MLLVGTITLKENPTCPMCKSSHVGIEIAEGECLCRGNCWSRPVCYSCGFLGWANSEGNVWHSHLQDRKETKNGN